MLHGMDGLQEDIIRTAFLCCGISNKLDGSEDHLLHVQIPGRRRGQRRRHLGEADGQDEETDIMQNISYRYTRRKHVSVKTLLLPLR